jgi:hypothetical protein
VEHLQRGSVVASEYRAYVLDGNDQIVARHEFEAENSTEALETARRYVNGHDVEVWQRKHIIGRLRSDKPPARS